MCGIAGIAAARDVAEAEAAVKAMCDRLAHRGPDSDGVHADRDGGTVLGHRRLTIIDLTDGGLQPMLDASGRFAMTYNGEIYNYRELRAELEAGGARFRSESDSEVLLEGFARWGTGVLDKLRGMFAFAIWDARERRLVAARDALGVKPLLWAQRADGSVAFASEAKALVGCGGVDTTHDFAALGDYLTYGYVPHPRTAWRGIRTLPPGSVLDVRDGTATVTSFWDRAFPAETADMPVDAVREVLGDAVGSQLVADVPVGVLLSSGIDSSSVASLAAQAQPGLLSFTMSVGEGERSEAPEARALAERFGLVHHEEPANPAIDDSSIDEVLDVYDEPFADSSALPTMALSRLARRHVKVAISGDGGDEIFGGYHRFHQYARLEQLDERIPRPAAALAGVATGVLPARSRAWRATRLVSANGLERYAAMATLFAPDLYGRVAGPALTGVNDDQLWALRRYWRPELDAVSRCSYVDLRSYLPDDILTKVDRASMRYSLEVRPPLLDTRLVESITRLPVGARFREGEQKPLLRAALNGEVPESVFTSKKQGFSLPLNSWVQERAASSGLVGRLRSGPVCTEGFVRADRLEQLTKPPFSGHHLWAVMVLDGWLRRQ